MSPGEERGGNVAEMLREGEGGGEGSGEPDCLYPVFGRSPHALNHTDANKSERERERVLYLC